MSSGRGAKHPVYSLVFFIFFLSSVSVWGQTPKSLYVDFLVINQLPRLRSIPEIPQIKKTFTYSMASAFILKQEIHKRIFFCYGVLYSPQGQKYLLPKEYNGSDYQGSVLLRYGKVPLYLQYHYILKPNFRAFVAGGFQPAMLILEEGSLPVYFHSAGKDMFHPGSAFREFGIEGMINTGVDIRVFENVFFTTQVRFDHGLNRAEKKHVIEYAFSSDFDLISDPMYSIRNTRNMTLGWAGGFLLKVR